MLRAFLMTTLLVGCAALRIAPTRGVFKPAVTSRRVAVIVMDEESEVYGMPFANVTAAAADIKELVLAEEAEATSPEAAAKAAWLAKTYGEPPSTTIQGAAEAPAPASKPSEELLALTKEKEELDAALLHGYDAEKVKRLAEVEAMLAEAGATPEPTQLSPEEVAKAAWLARNTRPLWGPGS